MSRQIEIRKKGVLILVFIIVAHIFYILFPLILADGSVDAQPIWVEYNVNNQLPDGFGSQDDTETIENTIRLSYLTFKNGTSYNYTITEIRVHQYCSGTAGQTNYLTYLIYNGTTSSPYATDLLYNFTIERDGSIYGWFAQSCNIVIPIGPNGVYIGAWMASETGNWHIYRDTTVSGAYTAHKSQTHPGSLGAQAPDPLTGESQDTGYAVEVTIDYNASGSLLTSHNQYYGSEDDYTARRDIPITFPSGTLNRQLQFIYPRFESIVNITNSNGGLWNEVLNSSDYTQTVYNASHYLITIPDETITLYEGPYRLFTSGPSPPIIDDVDATTAFSAQSYGWVNATVTEYGGVVNLFNVTLFVNMTGAENFTLRWTQSTGLFDEVSDLNNSVIMQGSVRENLEWYTDKICFRFQISGTEGDCDAQVIVFNDVGLNDTEDYSDLFAYTGVAWDPIGDIINSAFSLFGISTYMTQAINFVSEISAHFTNSLVNLATMINLQFQIIWQVFSRIVDWFTRIISAVINFGDTIHDITTGIATGTINLWTYFNFSNILDLIPIFLIIFWIESVYKRGNTQGFTQVLWNDAQSMINIFTFFMSAFATVISYIEGKINWLFQALT